MKSNLLSIAEVTQLKRAWEADIRDKRKELLYLHRRAVSEAKYRFILPEAVINAPIETYCEVCGVSSVVPLLTNPYDPITTRWFCLNHEREFKLVNNIDKFHYLRYVKLDFPSYMAERGFERSPNHPHERWLRSSTKL
jgi:hypothetical protein